MNKMLLLNFMFFSGKNGPKFDSTKRRLKFLAFTMLGHLLSSDNLSPDNLSPDNLSPDNLSRQLFLYVYNQTSQPLRKISKPVQIGPKITFLKTT